MPSPVAHSLVGLMGYFAATPAEKFKSFTDLLRENRREILFFIFAANIPDIDILAGFLFLRDFHIYHGQVSHSLLFAILISSVIALIYPIQKSRLKTFLISLALITIHDLMDCSASYDLSKTGTGVWLFYPLQERISSPYILFYGFQHHTFEQLFSLHNLYVIGFELLEFSILLFIIYIIKRKFLYSWNLLDGKGVKINDTK